jgi:hypothetical protein
MSVKDNPKNINAGSPQMASFNELTLLCSFGKIIVNNRKAVGITLEDAKPIFPQKSFGGLSFER